MPLPQLVSFRPALHASRTTPRSINHARSWVEGGPEMERRPHTRLAFHPDLSFVRNHAWYDRKIRGVCDLPCGDIDQRSGRSAQQHGKGDRRHDRYGPGHDGRSSPSFRQIETEILLHVVHLARRGGKTGGFVLPFKLVADAYGDVGVKLRHSLHGAIDTDELFHIVQT